MQRLTGAAYLRIILLALVGLLLTDYLWVRSHPGLVRPRSIRSFGMPLAGNACPDPETLRAQPGEVPAGAARTDYAWELRELEGREVSFEEFRNKVVFVNVWATWCGPCVHEMPSIQALHDATGKDGVAFVVVSEESSEKVRSFVEREKYSFPVYTTEKLPEVFESRSIPATFVVDRQGKIVHKHLGAADWNSDACRKYLRALL